MLRFRRHFRVFLLVTSVALASVSASEAHDYQSSMALVASEIVNFQSCVPRSSSSSSNSSPSQPCPPPANPDLEKAEQLNAQSRQVFLSDMEGQEKDFFYDLTRDQIRESKCEVDFLNQLDQLPSLPDAPRDMSLKDGIQRVLENVQSSSSVKTDANARAMQKEILDDIWIKLSAIGEVDKEIKKAKDEIPEDPTPTVNHSEGGDFYRRLQEYQDKEKAYREVLAKRDTIMSSIWSGSDPVMQDYVETALRYYKKGVSYDRFMKAALDPVDPVPAELSLQKKVIEPLKRSALQRICDYQTYSEDNYERSLWNDDKKKGYCGNYKATSGWSEDPAEQSNAERLRKRLLMQGNAALDFMQKVPKYRQSYKEFSCMLVGKYNEGPKVLYWTWQGIVFVGTLGASSWLQALAAAEDLEALGALARFALSNTARTAALIGVTGDLPRLLTHDCAGYLSDDETFGKSLQTGSVCEEMRPGQPLSVELLHQDIKKRNCATGMLMTAVGLATAGLTSQTGSAAAEKVRESAHKYVDELEAQGPLRLLIKERAEEPVGFVEDYVPKPDAKWYSGLGAKITQSVPRRFGVQIHPVEATYDLVQVKALGEKKIFTLPIKLAIFGVGNYYAFSGTESYLDRKRQQKRDAALDHLVDQDYRFRDIMKEAQQLGLPPVETRKIARSMTQERLDSYQTYYSTMDALLKKGLKYDNPKITEKLLEDTKIAPQVTPIFKDLMVLQTEKFWTQPGFKYHQKPGMTDQQLQDIVVAINGKMILTSKVQELAESADPRPKSDIEKAILEDPFMAEIVELRRQHKISADQEIYALMEEIDWRTRFKEWDVLHITAPFGKDAIHKKIKKELGL